MFSFRLISINIIIFATVNCKMIRSLLNGSEVNQATLYKDGVLNKDSDDAFVEEVTPDAVGDGFGKEGILLRDEPVGEGVAAVFVAGDFYWRCGSDQKLRCDDAAVFGVLHFIVGTLIVDDFFADFVARTEPDYREEGGHLVVLILSPLLEGVIMALGANHADPEEDLGGFFHGGFGFAGGAKVVGGGVVVRGAATGEEFASHLVVRLVGGDGLVDPFAETEGAFFTEELAGGLEEIAPFDGPMVGVGGARDQFVDAWRRTRCFGE